jgi:hypothetical protein
MCHFESVHHHIIIPVYITLIITYGFCRMADERQATQARARASFADVVLVLCFPRATHEELTCKK